MISINGIRWRILLVSPNHPALCRDDGYTFALGCCDSNLKTIFINDSVDCEYMKKILCHELVHACMYSYDVPLDYYQEEVVADLIATYG